MKMRRFSFFSLLIFSGFLLACPCAARTYSRAYFIMGTTLDITVFNDDENEANEAMDAAYQEVKKIDACASVYNDKSEAVKFNRQNPGKAFTASALFFSLVRQSLEYYRMTGGYFDATVFPFVKLWGFYEGKPPDKFPSKKTVQLVLKSTGSRAVYLDETHMKITKQKNVQMDFGGIAKGFALDLAAKTLKERGIRNARLDFRSTTLYAGSPESGTPFLNAVSHPHKKDRILFYLNAHDTSVSVSGNTERFFASHKIKYAHILNPKTGMPVAGALSMAVVLCKTAACADALSTALFVMGVKKGKAFLKKHPDVSVVFVEEKQKKFFIRAQKKLKSVLVFNKQKNKNAVLSFF